MTYAVTLTAGARRDIHRLPVPVAHAVLEFCATALASNPHRVGQPLVNELAGLHAARRGEYRIIYQISDVAVTVMVVRVRHRGTAYRPS